MNILIIPSWYHTKNNMTLGSFFKEQAEALAELGHDVTVLYVDRFGVSYLKKYISYCERTEYTDNNVKVYRKKKLRKLKSGPIGDCYSFANGILELYEKYIKHTKQIDLIHAHSCLWAGYAAMNLKEKYGIPYVITEHFTGYSRNMMNDDEKALIRVQISKADKLIAVSEGLKKDLQPYCNKKEIEVIPNMVDVSRFKLGEVSESNKKFVFLSICYLMYKKGIDILINAFAKAFKGDNNFQLYIGGDGEEKEKLIQLTISLGIKEQVKFLGELDRESVVKEMQNCNAFVLPSRFETFGVVFIEALACGKPIIASKTGGPDNIVRDINGYLVDVGDIDDLFRTMIKLVNEYKKFESFTIRKDCIERFSKENVINRIDQMYKKIVL
ncbi:glycosyltransferase [Clostridium fungisolvens]|uniref:Glycogen synthase n=1 Tax=Clostridium fungisolvens TaxID=1604897 RepID=A0A6V8SBH0_9CLOT|nr:glycosyltransferase [Clostridium fungisolvens]GFP74201.1 Glycogen synthase [Clostridium fungisolvens]